MGKPPSGLDVAMLKFCYLDLTAQTDARMLFARYRETVRDLRAKTPGRYSSTSRCP